jgi:hypothetical protein
MLRLSTIGLNGPSLSKGIASPRKTVLESMGNGV